MDAYTSPDVTLSGLLSSYREKSGNATAQPDDMFSDVMGPKVSTAAFNGLLATFNLFKGAYISVTDATDAALVSVINRIAALENIPSQYVASGTMTIASLLANYPPSASNFGKYARVSDLYGSVDDIMRCRYDGTNYRWVPQRADFNMVASAAGGSVTLTPLVTPPTVRIGGTLTGSITFGLVNTNAYIGQRFRVVTSGIGVYLATVTGLIGSNLTLLGNKTTDIEYGAAGWFAVAG